jgi:hypothetical protein
MSFFREEISGDEIGLIGLVIGWLICAGFAVSAVARSIKDRRYRMDMEKMYHKKH